MRSRIVAFTFVAMLAACTRTPPNVPHTVNTSSAGSCVAVDVATSPDVAPQVSKVAGRFNGSRSARLRGGGCAFVRVQPVESGDAYAQLVQGWPATNVFGPRPSAWMPGANAWIARLNEQHGAVRATAHASFLRTPLVLAMPRGTPASRSVFEANPLTSTTGLLATLVAPPLPQSVVYYAPNDSVFLENAQRSASTTPIITSQRAVDAYNRGIPNLAKPTKTSPRPRVPLVTVPVARPAVDLDYPLATLDAPWVSPRARAGAAAFVTFVGGPPVAASLPVTPVLDRWQRVRKPARVLVLFDVSESMNDPFDTRRDSGPSKLDTAKQALIEALPLLGPNDRIGLRTFDTHWDDVVPIGPLTPAYASAVNGLRARGGSALYAATRDAFDAVDRSADPAHIDGIVLLTDGYDEANGDLNALLAHLRPTVPIFVIPYSAQADLKTLRRIAAATGGYVFDATDPRLIGPSFTDALASF